MRSVGLLNDDVGERTYSGPSTLFLDAKYGSISLAYHRR